MTKLDVLRAALRKGALQGAHPSRQVADAWSGEWHHDDNGGICFVFPKGFTVVLSRDETIKMIEGSAGNTKRQRRLAALIRDRSKLYGGPGVSYDVSMFAAETFMRDDQWWDTNEDDDPDLG